MDRGGGGGGRDKESEWGVGGEKDRQTEREHILQGLQLGFLPT